MISDMMIEAWLVATGELPGYLSYPCSRSIQSPYVPPVVGRCAAGDYLLHKPREHRRPDGIKTGLQKAFKIDFFVRQGFDGGYETCRVYGETVMADRRRRSCQRHCTLWIARIGHSPAIDEDLGADLLSHCAAVERDGAAFRCRDSLLETKVGSVLRGAAETAPPQHSQRSQQGS